MISRGLAVMMIAVLLAFVGCGSHLAPGDSPLAAGPQTSYSTVTDPGKRQRYLYLSSRCCTNQHLYSFTYPQLQSYGSSAGAYFGGCSDSAGNVYFAGDAAVDEFSNGSTTPIKSLQIPSAIVWDCAVDPTTGDLAADVWFTQTSEQGVEVFTSAQGTPTFYPESMFSYSCTYDGAGNLFLVGTSSSGNLISDELPKDGAAFEQITVNTSVPSASTGVRWDGTYLVAIVPQRRQKSYFQQIEVSGSTGTVVETSPLTGHGSAAPSAWPFAAIAGGKIVDPTLGGFGVFRYPRGGNALQTIPVAGGEGVAVSGRGSPQ